jgi:drug/metabolite transporter (DMT)-like permease
MQNTNSAHALNAGILFAILAALLNSTAGIFSKILLEHYDSNDIAFAKCLVAFILVGIFLLATRAWRNIVWNWELIAEIAVCALFVCGMYAFETMAYKNVVAPVVVLCLMGASTVTTLIIGHFWLKEKLTRITLFCLALILMGLYFMLPANAHVEHYMGLLWGILSGVCYGMFLLLAKRFNISSNMITIWLLVGFGMIYLLPLTSNSHMLLLDTAMLPYLVPLAIFPTFLGFYYTTKALNFISASKVQLFEVSEPIFSGILAYIVLNELMSGRGYVGAVIIVGTLILYQRTSGKA